MKIPLLHGPYGTDVYEGADIYTQPGLSGGRGGYVGANFRVVMPCDGRFTRHMVSVENPPVPGQSMDFWLRVGANDYCGLTLFTPDTSAENSDWLDVSAGDILCHKIVGSAACGNTIHQHAFVFEPTTPGQQPFMGAVSVSPGTDWISLNGHPASGTETRAWSVVPIPGKFKNLYLASNDGPMSGDCTVTLKKNGVAQSLARTLAAGATDASDLAHEVSVVAGDYVYFEVAAAGADEVAWGVVFESTDPTLWFLTSARGRVSPSGTAYNWINGGTLHTVTNQWQSDEYVAGVADRRCIWPVGPKVTGMYVLLSAAPGVGQSRTITLRKDGNPTAITVTISGAAISGSHTGELIEPADFDLLSLIHADSGAPASAQPMVALIGTSVATTLTAANPNQGARKATLDVVLTGDNFTGATDVSFEGVGITVNSYTVDTDEQITVNITISPTATCDARDVTVTTPLNAATLTDGFTIIPAPPVVASLTPASGVQGVL